MHLKIRNEILIAHVQCCFYHTEADKNLSFDIKFHYHHNEISFTVILLISTFKYPRNSTILPELQLTQQCINVASRRMEIVTKRYYYNKAV